MERLPRKILSFLKGKLTKENLINCSTSHLVLFSWWEYFAQKLYEFKRRFLVYNCQQSYHIF